MEAEAKVLETFIVNWQLFTGLGITVICLFGFSGYLIIGEDFKNNSQSSEGSLESQDDAVGYD